MSETATDLYALPVPSEREYAEAHRIAYAPLFFQGARAAQRLGLLDALADAPAGLDEGTLHAQTGASPYAITLALNACTSLQMVSRVGDRFQITGVGVAFLRDSQLQKSAEFVHHVCHQGAFHMEEALRTGRPAGLRVHGEWSTVYEAVPHLPTPVRESWYAYDHQYSDAIFVRAIRFLRHRFVRRVLDVGANTGRFARLAGANMDVTMLDHPAELAIARRNVDEAGVGDRVHAHPIELLDHSAVFPGGHDAAWMSQVLDCFAEDDIVGILERARAALLPGGRVFVVESFTDRQPTEAAEIALHGLSLYFACIANGNSRMYSADVLIRCGERAGLTLEEDRTLGPWHTLLVFRK